MHRPRTLQPPMISALVPGGHRGSAAPYAGQSTVQSLLGPGNRPAHVPSRPPVSISDDSRPRVVGAPPRKPRAR